MSWIWEDGLVGKLVPSTSAQHVALGRAHLTARGIIDDDFAVGMLRPPWSAAHRVLSRRPFSLLGRSPSLAYLAARTRFYDEHVRWSLGAGYVQVVALGAGYDSRAWRLARAGVTFFEVDNPVTQADKQARAPRGGPIYVAADLRNDQLSEVLKSAGFQGSSSTVFTLEGLTMYLADDAVSDLLVELADLSGPRGLLLANFGIGFERDGSALSRGKSTLMRGLISRREPFRFKLLPKDASSYLKAVGWQLQKLETGPDLAARYLAGTDLAELPLNAKAFAVVATRDGLSAHV